MSQSHTFLRQLSSNIEYSSLMKNSGKTQTNANVEENKEFISSNSSIPLKADCVLLKKHVASLPLSMTKQPTSPLRMMRLHEVQPSVSDEDRELYFQIVHHKFKSPTRDHFEKTLSQQDSGFKVQESIEQVEQLKRKLT
jgi:hypothetical protein